MEHRCGERVPVQAPALLKINDIGWITGCLKNISIGGIYVETGCIFPANTCLLVRVELYGANSHWIEEFPCVVVHTNNSGMGLMLSAVDQMDSSTLQQLSGEGEIVDPDGRVGNFPRYGSAMNLS